MRELIRYDDVYLHRQRLYGDDGKLICINCGKSLPPRRWLYCSDKCNMAFYKKHVKDWQVLREDIFKRDNFTCAECGFKADFINELECDHIVPISLGGSEFDRNNLQTLCKRCHKRKTAVDRGKYGKTTANVALGSQKTLFEAVQSE